MPSNVWVTRRSSSMPPSTPYHPGFSASPGNSGWDKPCCKRPRCCNATVWTSKSCCAPARWFARVRHSYNDPKLFTMTTLLITLPIASTDAVALYDYVLAAEGSAELRSAGVPLGLLPMPPDRQTEVLVVLPMQALSWHQVQ